MGSHTRGGSEGLRGLPSLKQPSNMFTQLMVWSDHTMSMMKFQELFSFVTAGHPVHQALASSESAAPKKAKCTSCNSNDPAAQPQSDDVGKAASVGHAIASCAVM